MSETFDASTMAILRPKVDDNTEALAKFEATETELVVAATTEEPVVEETPKKFLQDKVAKLAPIDRAVHNITVALNTWLDMTNVSDNRMKALQSVISLMTKFPERVIYNTILDFFKANRTRDIMHPMRSHQHLQKLTSATHMRAQVLLNIMIDLASNQASRKTVNLEEVRRQFGSDNFVNWVDSKLRR